MKGDVRNLDVSGLSPQKAAVVRYMQIYTMPSDEEAMATVEEIIHVDYDFDDPPLPEKIRGIDGAKKFFMAERQVFGPRSDAIELLLEDGKYVVAQAVHQGVYSGDDFLGLDGKNERAAKATTIGIFEFADGKIIKHISRYDSLNLMVQMGMIPSMEEIQQLKTSILSK